jgi:hypothetical protein
VDPFPQILAAALTRCYEELGWDLSLGEPVRDGPRPRYPTLADLQRVAAVEVTDIGYGKEANDNVQGFLKVRLNSLRRGTTGRFFEGGHPLDFKKLLHRNVVLEIQNVGDDADKAFFMGAVLIRLTEHLRGKAGDPELSHLTVVEEAHRLLRRQEAGPGAQAVEMFAALLAEVRAYGEGLIIAEQIPGKLIVDAIKNTAVKIVHRLPAADDRESVGATMNLDDAQSRYLVTLRPGDGAVFTDGMDHPLLVHVPEGTAIEGRGTPALAPVNELIGRRSVTCGPDCVARACTLRDMRKGQHVLLEHPWLVVWAELTVLAHLAGHPAPLVDAAYPRLVAGQPRQVLDCAISHAVDDAIAVRSAQLHPSVHADGFAEHCCAILRAGLAGQDTRVVCDRDGLGYLSSTYQWLLARDPLLSSQREAPAHPDTPLWERHFRRPVPGRTVGEQLDVVNIWWAATLRNQTARDAVTFGTQRPSALETAIGGPATDPRWRDWLPGALMPFPGCDWPPAHLLPPQPKEPS